MDATDLESFANALIDDLATGPPPEHDANRRLYDLLDSPRRVLDEKPLLAVLVAAVTARNLLDLVIAAAVAAAERPGSQPAGTYARGPICSPTSGSPRGRRGGRCGSGAPHTPCRH